MLNNVFTEEGGTLVLIQSSIPPKIWAMEQKKHIQYEFENF